VEQVIYWVTVALVLWFSMPALAAREKRALGVVLAVLLPLFSWVWLVWIGIGHRMRAETGRRLATENAERERLAHDVAFWRGRARTGTPAEQEAARMYLEALGYAVEPGPAEVHAEALKRASGEELAGWARWFERRGDYSEAYQAVRAEVARRREVTPGDVVPYVLKTGRLR
jgi:hypothetical protein